jgi:hypothetical protein
MQTTVDLDAPQHPADRSAAPMPQDAGGANAIVPNFTMSRRVDPREWFDEQVAEVLRDGGRLVPTAAQAFAAEREKFRAQFPLVSARLAHLLADPGPAPPPDGQLLDPGEVAVDRSLVGGYGRYVSACARGDCGLFNDRPGVAAANAASIARGEGVVLARYAEPLAGGPNGPYIDVAIMLSPGGNRTVVARAEGHHPLAPPA